MDGIGCGESLVVGLAEAKSVGGSFVATAEFAKKAVEQNEF